MSLQPHEIKSQEQLIQYLVETQQAIVHVPRQLLVQTLGQDAQELLPTLPDYIAINTKRAVELCQKNHPQSIHFKTTSTT